MGLQKYRMAIALALFAALLVVTVLVVRNRTEEKPEAADEHPSHTVSDIDKAAITEIEIRRPEGQTVKLAKRGAAWRLIAPVDAEADANAVESALDKLDDLEIVGVAARRKENHERLEVDERHGIHVLARGNGKTLADVIVGAFRGGNTMLRLQGQDEVLSARGSIKFVFNKDVKDWRDRRVSDIAPADVKAVSFVSDKGRFRFVRNAQNEWAQAERERPIERFSGSKVESFVASLARMRAVDFAEANVTPEQAGLTQSSATVTLTYQPTARSNTPDAGHQGSTSASGQSPQELVLELGHKLEADRGYYIRRRGDDTVYIVSQFSADRLMPSAEGFQTPLPTKAGEGAEGGEPTPTLEGPVPPGAQNPNSIPPEVLEQLRRQMPQKRP